MSDGYRVKHTVITIHGIRTYGRWQNRFATILRRDIRWKIDGEKKEILNYRYGVFTLFSFLIPYLRNLAVKQFRNYLESVFEGRNCDRVDIVAHSFGTYLATEALAHPDLPEKVRIHTAIYCGSAVSPNRNLSRLVGANRRISRLINECGTRDNVLITTLLVFGVGMAGRFGFQGFEGQSLWNRYHVLGHSGYFELRKQQAYEGFMRRWWLPLLLGNGPVPDRDRRPDSPPLSDRFLRLLGENGGKITLLIYALLFASIGTPIWYLNNEVSVTGASLSEAEALTEVEKSKVLAGQAREHADRYEYGAALNTALSALSTGAKSRTEPIEATAALYNAALNLRELVVYNHKTANLRVLSAIFTPDEANVITSGDDGFIRVWETATGRHLYELECHSCSMSISNGTQENARLMVWDAWKSIISIYAIETTGLSKQPMVLDTHTQTHISHAEFDRSGRWVVSTSQDGIILLWDVTKPNLQPTRTYKSIEKFVYASVDNNQKIVALSKSGVVSYFEGLSQSPTKSLRIDCELWDDPSIQTDAYRELFLIGCVKGTILFSKLDGSSSKIPGNGTAFGSTLTSTTVMLGRYDGKIDIYDTRPKITWVRQLALHKDVVQAFAQRRSSNPRPFLVSASKDHKAIIWMDSLGLSTAVLAGHEQELLTVALASKSDRILTGAADHTARLWSLYPVSVVWKTAPKNWTVAPLDPPLTSQANVSLRARSDPDGAVRVLGSDGHEIAQLGKYDGHLVANCLSPTGKYLAIGTDDNKIEIWLTNGWKQMAMIDFTHVLPARLTGIDLSPDGKSFVASFFLAESVATWPVLESTNELIDFAKRIVPESGDH